MSEADVQFPSVPVHWMEHPSALRPHCIVEGIEYRGGRGLARLELLPEDVAKLRGDLLPVASMALQLIENRTSRVVFAAGDAGDCCADFDYRVAREQESVSLDSPANFRVLTKARRFPDEGCKGFGHGSV